MRRFENDRARDDDADEIDDAQRNPVPHAESRRMRAMANAEGRTRRGLDTRRRRLSR